MAKQPGKITRKEKKQKFGNVQTFEESRALMRRRKAEDDRKRCGWKLNREFNGGEG